MKRDLTISLALAVFGIWIVAGLTGLVPPSLNEAKGLGRVLFWFVLVAGIRLYLLFFQTLLHSWHFSRHRAGWITAHILGSVFASIWYYLSNREHPSGHRAR